MANPSGATLLKETDLSLPQKLSTIIVPCLRVGPIEPLPTKSETFKEILKIIIFCACMYVCGVCVCVGGVSVNLLLEYKPDSKRKN